MPSRKENNYSLLSYFWKGVAQMSTKIYRESKSSCLESKENNLKALSAHTDFCKSTEGWWPGGTYRYNMIKGTVK